MANTLKLPVGLACMLAGVLPDMNKADHLELAVQIAFIVIGSVIILHYLSIFLLPGRWLPAKYHQLSETVSDGFMIAGIALYLLVGAYVAIFS